MTSKKSNETQMSHFFNFLEERDLLHRFFQDTASSRRRLLTLKRRLLLGDTNPYPLLDHNITWSRIVDIGWSAIDSAWKEYYSKNNLADLPVCSPEDVEWLRD